MVYWVIFVLEFCLGRSIINLEEFSRLIIACMDGFRLRLFVSFLQLSIINYMSATELTSCEGFTNDSKIYHCRYLVVVLPRFSVIWIWDHNPSQYFFLVGE